LVLFFSECLFLSINKSFILRDKKKRYIISTLETLDQVTIKKVRFLMKIKPLQKEIFRAFGISDKIIQELEIPNFTDYDK
jgi:hypothetical protein